MAARPKYSTTKALPMLKYHGASHDAHFLGPGCHKGGPVTSGSNQQATKALFGRQFAVLPPTSRLAFQCVVPSARGSPLRQIEIPRSPARPWCPYAVRWPLQAAPSVLAFVPIDRGETCDTGLRRGRQRSAGQDASYLISTLQRGPVSLAAAVGELTATIKCMAL